MVKLLYFTDEKPGIPWDSLICQTSGVCQHRYIGKCILTLGNGKIHSKFIDWCNPTGEFCKLNIFLKLLLNKMLHIHRVVLMPVPRGSFHTREIVFAMWMSWPVPSSNSRHFWQRPGTHVAPSSKQPGSFLVSLPLPTHIHFPCPPWTWLLFLPFLSTCFKSFLCNTMLVSLSFFRDSLKLYAVLSSGERCYTLRTFPKVLTERWNMYVLMF